MKKAIFLTVVLALAACGAKPDSKPAQRPATVKVGEPAPQIKLEKIVSGGRAAINGWEDLKGKAAVLEFWGTYCDPCIENIPHLNALAEKFKDKPVVFISISREDEKSVRDFLKDHEMKGLVAAAAPAAFKDYRVTGVPHTVLVDRESRVNAVTYPSNVDEGTIEALLAGKPAAGASAAGSIRSPANDAKAFFSVAPSINGRSMRTSAGRLEMDGHTLAESIEKVVEPARAVEYNNVDPKLLGEKYALTIQIDPVKARRPGALRDLGVAGLNSAFPLRIATVRKERMVYLIKKAGSFPGALKETPGSGFSYSSGFSKSSQTKQIVSWSYDAKRASIAGLADALGEWAKTPVLDETGLGNKGYVFAAKFASLDPDGLRAGLAPLGLKLEEARRVVEVAEVTGVKN